MKNKLYIVFFLFMTLLSCKSEEEKLIEKITDFPEYSLNNYKKLVEITGNEHPDLFIKVLKAHTESLLSRYNRDPDNDRLIEMWDSIYRIQNEKSFKYIELFIEKFEDRVEEIESDIRINRVLNGSSDFQTDFYYGLMENLFETILWSYYTKVYRIDAKLANEYIDTRIPKDNKRYNNAIKEIKNHNFENDIDDNIYSVENLPEEFNEILIGINNEDAETFKLLDSFTIKETTLPENEDLPEIMKSLKDYRNNSELVSYYFILISQIKDSDVQFNYIKGALNSYKTELKDQAESFLIEFSNKETINFVREKLENETNNSPQIYTALYLHDLEKREEILKKAYLDSWNNRNRLDINLLLLDILENK